MRTLLQNNLANIAVRIKMMMSQSSKSEPEFALRGAQFSVSSLEQHILRWNISW